MKRLFITFVQIHLGHHGEHYASCLLHHLHVHRGRVVVRGHHDRVVVRGHRTHLEAVGYLLVPIVVPFAFHDRAKRILRKKKLQIEMCYSYQPQFAEWTLNKIEKTFKCNGTFEGLKCMLQRFRICFI